MSHTFTTAMLEAFTDAWNRHDVEGLLHFMHTDGVFLTAGGPDACGSRHQGHEALRKAFPGAWTSVPDAQWIKGQHFVHGDFGVSEWTYVGTCPDGSRVETEGVDIFAFKDGKILSKSAFRKNRPNLPALK